VKSPENVEKFVRQKKPNVKTSRQMDKMTLNGSFMAMDEAMKAQRALKYKIIKALAAAAVIILLIGLFVLSGSGPDEQNDIRQGPVAAKSPVEAMTLASVNMAYRRGGLEEVERQFEKAIKERKPPLRQVTTEELLAEFNGI
jgi:hypothetical protein